MLNTEKSRESYSKYVNEIIPLLKRKGYHNFKADLPDYEVPSKFTLQGEVEIIYMPDISAVYQGRPSYIEISSRTDNVEQLVSKWKLLSKVLGMKDGTFNIVTPRGTIKFTREVLAKHNIEAELIQI